MIELNSLQVEYLSAKTLAQDMHIEELEQSISDAARMMLDDGCYAANTQQLTDWLNATATRSSYLHKHRTHIQVYHLTCSLIIEYS